MFELFDPLGEVDVRAGSSLPHWYQPDVTYFITFRTDDSMPARVARAWHHRREDWLRQHGIDPRVAAWQTALAALPREAQREFHEIFSREYLEYLDRGHGECVLRLPELAAIVTDSLRHFDGQRYHLGDFVVMPNHVHLLVCLLGETELGAQCDSWKHFSATQINRHLSRRGRFWQEESFDHLVRTPEQFDAIRQYIAANPLHARLSPGTYLHHRRSEQEK